MGNDRHVSDVCWLIHEQPDLSIGQPSLARVLWIRNAKRQTSSTVKLHFAQILASSRKIGQNVACISSSPQDTQAVFHFLSSIAEKYISSDRRILVYSLNHLDGIEDKMNESCSITRVANNPSFAGPRARSTCSKLCCAVTGLN